MNELINNSKFRKEQLKKLILKIVAPFIPAPLIDKSISMNYSHWLARKGTEEYWVFLAMV